jgi:class 3 adenylate cyclase
MDHLARSDTDRLLALETYVPPFIRWHLARDPSPHTAPFEDRYLAAVLHADIAGFTSMAERCAADGASGAEQVRNTLRRFLQELGATVAAHDGYTLTFAGDSATAMWPVLAEVDLGSAVRRAIHCGVDVREKLDGARFAGKPDRPRLHLTIGAGEVRAAAVGGVDDRWLPMVYGQAFVHLTGARSRQTAGRIIASREAWEVAGPGVTGEHLDDGMVIVTSPRVEVEPRRTVVSHVPTSAEVALRRYVPRSIQARLDAGGTDWDAEFRHATVAFVHTRGTGSVAAWSASDMHRLVQPMQQAVFTAGGSVNKVLADGDGVVLIAAWGLSQHAYEDNAVRAVRAALEIRRRLQSIDVGSSIGVATGRVFMGSAGTDDHKEYAIIGDVVNVAARLADGGGVGVRCDADTRLESRARVLFEPGEPRKLRGRSDPVSVYEPRAEKPVRRDRDDLIGRSAERARLREALDRLERGGTSSVIAIEGEAGIGKSRLAADLVAQTQQRPVQSLVGWGEPMESSTAYHAWREIFAHLLRLDLVSDRDAQRTHVLEVLGTPERQARVSLTNVVLPLDFPETADTDGLRPAARARATRDLLVHLFTRATAGRPMVLVLEDAHWMDSASWALAYHLAQSGAPVLMVTVARLMQPDQMCLDWRSLRDAEWTTRMHLESLAPDDALALACLRLDCDALPPEVSDAVLRVAEGHPFFTEQLVLAMRDTDRVIRIEGGECHVTSDVSQVGFASTVRALVDSRVGGLTEPQQDTLKVAAVLGRRFDLWSLRSAHPDNPETGELQKQLDALVDLELLRVDAPAPGRLYRFKHGIVQEAVLGWLLPAERKNLNARVARMLEEQHPADLTPVHARLAHHWREAGVVSKALDYLELAAQRALKEDANQEAQVFLLQAIELGRSVAGNPALSVRMALWTRQLAEALWVMGDTQHARQHIADAMAELRRESIRPGTALATQVVIRLGQSLLPKRFLATHDPIKRQHLMEASRVAALYAILHSDPVDHVGAFTGGLMSHNLAVRAGSANVHALAMLGYGAALLGCGRIGGAYFTRMRREAQAQKDLRPLLFGLLLEAMKHFSDGHIARSEQCLHEGLDWAGEAGNQRDRARLQILLGATTCFSGRMAEGLAHVRQAYELARYEREASLERTWTLICLAGAYSQHLSPADAETRYRGLRDMIGDSMMRDRLGGTGTPNHLRGATCAALDALVHARAGHVTEALESIRGAEQFLASPLNLFAVHPTAWILFQGSIEAYWNAWDVGAQERPELQRPVLAAARRFTQILTRFAWLHPIYRPRAWLFAGKVAAMRGHDRRARALWQKSLAAAEAMAAAEPARADGSAPLAFDRALAAMALGGVERDSERRRLLLTRAATLFRGCETPYFEQRVQRLVDVPHALNPAGRP